MPAHLLTRAQLSQSQVIAPRPDPVDSLAFGLQAFWRINEGGNTLYDASGYGRHATKTGTISWVQSQKGLAIQSDGSTGLFNSSQAGWGVVGTPFTIAALVNLVQTGTITGVVGFAAPFDCGFEHHNASQLVNLQHNYGGSISPQMGYGTDGWHVISFGSDGATLTGYVDGIQGAQSSGAATLLNFNNPPPDFTIGSYKGDTPTLDVISWAGFWSRILTPAEHYRLGTRPIERLFQPVPMRRWLAPPGTVLLSPISDVGTPVWVTNTGATSNLYQAIDELVASDADYIQSPGQASPAVVEFTLTSAFGPDAGTRTLRYRYGKDAAGGRRVDLTVELLESGVVVQSWTHTDIGAGFSDAAQTVTATITNYASLSVRLTSTQV